jgi:hypothetical protein
MIISLGHKVAWECLRSPFISSAIRQNNSVIKSVVVMWARLPPKFVVMNFFDSECPHGRLTSSRVLN